MLGSCHARPWRLAIHLPRLSLDVLQGLICQQPAGVPTWMVKLQASLTTCCLIQPLMLRECLPAICSRATGRSSGAHASSPTTRNCTTAEEY